MQRTAFLSAVETALSLPVGDSLARPQAEFAREVSQEWLATWPGDYRVRLYLGHALLRCGEETAALAHLRQAMEADPEWVEPYRALSSALTQPAQAASRAEWQMLWRGLDSAVESPSPLPAWSDSLQSAFALAAAARWQEARWAAELVMRAAPSLPLPAVLYLNALYQLADHTALFAAAKESRRRWPGCAAVILLSAKSCFAVNRSAEAVELLHAASMVDPAGDVAARYLGPDHPYKPLWAASLTADIRTPIPAEVIRQAGWNRLPGTQQTAAATEPENGPAGALPTIIFPEFDSRHADEAPESGGVIAPLPGEGYAGPSSGDDEAPAEKTASDKTDTRPAKQVHPAGTSDLSDLQARLDKLSGKLRKQSKTGGQTAAARSAYVVLTSRNRLLTQVGAAAAEVERALDNLVQAKGKVPGWSAYLFDVEDAACMRGFGLDAVDGSKAWSVKHALTALSESLVARRETIGAVLIVGGHEVVPFHLLPNPTDDDDRDVPSDNPYATRDENFFIPEWAVGRLPVPQGDGGRLVIRTIDRMIETGAKAPKGLLEDILAWFVRWFRTGVTRPSFGVTAEVWKRASQEVFRSIGAPASLKVCPPLSSRDISAAAIGQSKYAYFNLHGMEAGPEWIGQCDVASAQGTEDDYPIALLPAQIQITGNAPAVVFTEACYGANILDKQTCDSMAMTFLETGTRALAGSTKICYGATSAPLIGADLLAALYLQNSKKGLTAGEALRQAKIAFTEEMTRRQGYLDPEDQKTLISFVLLGDPMFGAEKTAVLQPGKAAKTRRRQEMPKRMLWSKAAAKEAAPPAAVEKQLKQAMEKYLPGMDAGSMRILTPRFEEAGGPAATDGKRVGTPKLPAWVVSLDRSYSAGGHTQTQYARLSMDRSGRVMKVVVSR